MKQRKRSEGDFVALERLEEWMMNRAAEDF
jgi:hypothetical protein